LSTSHRLIARNPVIGIFFRIGHGGRINLRFSIVIDFRSELKLLVCSQGERRNHQAVPEGSSDWCMPQRRKNVAMQ
jgi:hypothetical protein